MQPADRRSDIRPEPSSAAVSPITELLHRYRPRTDVEAADVTRVRAMVEAGDPWPRSTPFHLTSSALIVHPPTRRVLLRWHLRQQAWIQVGGHADPGEVDPLAIALREGREETGLDDLLPWPDPSILHVVVVPVPEGGREPTHEHADVRFVLSTGTPEAARPERPTAPLRWLSLPEARETTAEENLHESLSRVAELFDMES
jgi:8-oxo-dGTP pyrophosphatase MutT (NUDIX family)